MSLDQSKKRLHPTVLRNLLQAPLSFIVRAIQVHHILTLLSCKPSVSSLHPSAVEEKKRPFLSSSVLEFNRNRLTRCYGTLHYHLLYIDQ